MKNEKIIFAIFIILDMILFMVNLKLAFLFLFFIMFFVFTFFNIKWSFYFFLFILPLSFNIHIGVGIQDMFLADGLFLIIIFVYFIKKILKSDLKITISPLTIYVVIFSVISLISILYNKLTLTPNELYRINSILHIKYAILTKQTIYPPKAGNIVLFLRTLYPIFLYIFVSDTFREREEYKMILKVIIFSGLFTVFYGWLLKFHMIPQSIYSLYTGYYLTAPLIRITSTFSNPQAFGSFLAILLTIIFYYNLQRPYDIFLWFLNFLVLSIFMYTYSLGAFAALFIAYLIVVLTHYKSSYLGKVLLIVLGLILIIFIFLKNRIIFSKIKYSLTYVNPKKQFPSTFEARIIQWGRWIKILRKHWLLGLGYPLVWTDNNYLKMVVNAGILGLISYFLIFFHLFLKGIKIIKNKKYNFIGVILIAIGSIFLIHSFSYDLSVIFKMNAYFYILAGIANRILYEEKNTI